MKIYFNGRIDNSIVGKILVLFYGINSSLIRKFILKSLWKILGKHHQFYSKTLRNIFNKYHKIEIGMYTHGGCFIYGKMHPYTKVGRYSSISTNAIFLNGNHPMNTKSSHAFFFSHVLGYTKNDLIQRTKLTIGNDVWIGDHAIILPSCKEIGDGAVIAAGAVVNKNVPPYAIMVGNPARVVRYRFSKEKIEELLASKWWEKSIEELLPELDSFQKPLEGEVVR